MVVTWEILSAGALVIFGSLMVLRGFLMTCHYGSLVVATENFRKEVLGNKAENVSRGYQLWGAVLNLGYIFVAATAVSTGLAELM